MLRERSGKNRGSALLVSLGVLALLAIMATTFVTMTRMDSDRPATMKSSFVLTRLDRMMLNPINTSR
jgi:hypothetical protein